MDNILEMKNISKSFNGVQVLNNVDLGVRPGEVHVLLGENGAGKSTLIKILSGAYRMEEGEIFLEGQPYVIHSPEQAIHKGISVIYQEFNLNPYVPIYENIFLGKEFMRRGFTDEKRAIEESRKYMDMIGLNVSPKTLVSELSVAQRQMVEIAKAISTNVKILVLDEPTAAITDEETERLFEIVRDLKKKNIGIIYISHRMQELFEIGDRCTVMRDGEFVKVLELDKTDSGELTELMVGRQVDFTKIKNEHKVEGYNMLSARNIGYKNFLKDISFDVKKGEIFGLAGLVGSGRTELAKCIMGAYKRSSGSVSIENGSVELPEHDITEVIRRGVVYLSEDRKDEGLILVHTVADNITLPSISQFVKSGLIDTKKLQSSAEEYSEKLRVKTTSIKQLVRNLSGGNQQKVVIAKWLLTNAKIYIFDEPTRGIDVGARDEIYNIMYDIVAQGNSIIMISSDLVEVLKMCDRVGVMREGQLCAIMDNDEVLSQKDILDVALHGGNHYEQ
ncbi:MAG: sugar ABC transporter ATP-binding protein [Christensenellaceae bacterium]|jgi:ribose transport system ATP-binding protein